MFTTALRFEPGLGLPSVPLNALTGHRPCPPEDCRGLVANPPQGSVPVSGVFPAGAILHLLETRLQAIRLSPYHADLPARHPVRLGMNCRFPGMLFSPATLSRPGQPSDPETSPLVPARCTGDTAVHPMAHVGWAARRGSVFRIDAGFAVQPPSEPGVPAFQAPGSPA